MVDDETDCPGRVSGSYLLGMRCTFPTRKVCIKPGMVQGSDPKPAVHTTVLS
jgi:hypothetical protein